MIRSSFCAGVKSLGKYLCLDNIHRIWESSSEQKSTQLVFCDLSTPHGDGKFNVYDDLKAKLIRIGIPEAEIAFIHDAKTEAQKGSDFAGSQGNRQL